MLRAPCPVYYSHTENPTTQLGDFPPERKMNRTEEPKAATSRRTNSNEEVEASDRAERVRGH